MHVIAEPAAQLASRRGTLINDVVIEIATMNGSGSQSANQILAHAIFKMGVPVGCKNLFPSNIQGMPTWFVVRANKHGWTARRNDADILVAMNKESLAEDLAKLRPGAIVVLRDDLLESVQRTDLELIPVPFGRLVTECCDQARLRRLVINIMYVGVLAYLLGVDCDGVHAAIESQFESKARAVALNKAAMAAAYDWAAQNLQPLERFRIEPMPETRNMIMIDGNTACALGAVWGGATVMAWYPITPSTTMPEAIIEYMRELRHDPATGKATYAIVQTEDELAAIGMLIGAGWAGARAITATSGPGLSLMAEQAGLAYFTECPAAIVNVQRMGPSTGMPTRTCQNDMLKAYFLSHGDCKHILLIPATMEECFEFTCESMNVAERFQTLVIVMTDLDLGMNVWTSEEFKFPTKPIDRGKVLSAADLERLGGFERYGDVDGDGIPYRTLPGTPHPAAAYFTRGTGHTPKATYTEKPEVWTANLDRLTRKFETARRELPRPIVHRTPGAVIGVIGYGSSDPAIREAMEILRTEHDLPVDYLRLRALPPHQDVYDFASRFRHVYVIDQNRDAQVMSILMTERVGRASGTRLRPVTHYNGLPIDARTIADAIAAQEPTDFPEIPNPWERGNGYGNGKH